MAQTIASINSLLVGLKTVNSSLLVKLQHLGFKTSLPLGEEQEYTVKSPDSLYRHTRNTVFDDYSESQPVFATYQL